MSQKGRISLSQAAAVGTQAPRSGDQIDLEDLIAAADKGDTERNRFKLVASPASQSEARRRAADMQRELSIHAAKQRRRRDTGPTPERAAKAAGIAAITPPISDGDTRALTRAHMVEGVVEHYQNAWAYETVTGARFLRDLNHEVQAGQRGVTVDLDAAGGSFGPRRGGFTNWNARVQNEVLGQVKAEIERMFGPECRDMLEAFLWAVEETHRYGRGPLDERLVRAGRALAPYVKAQDQLWGIALGHLLAMFKYAYARWVVMASFGQAAVSPPEEVRARLAQKRKRWEAAGLVEPARDGPAFKDRDGRQRVGRPGA